MAAFSVVPRHVLGGPKFVAPSEKINIAIIGCGGQGRTNVRALFNHPDAQIIAVADPIESENLDAFYFKGNAGRLPVKAEIEKHYGEKTPNFKVADYEDFRVMLEKEKAIDAILCATPDHQHAYVCVTAMRQGKHVYCEKPLTHNVWEARLVAKVAKETGVATQLGNQGHSGDFIRQTCEMIWDGAIGDVREVHAWTNASRWNTKILGGRPPGGAGPEGGELGFVAGAAGERGPTARPTRRSPGGTSGISAPRPSATSSAITLTRPAGRWTCANRSASKPPLRAGWTPISRRSGGLYTYHFGPRGKMPAVKFMWYEGGLMPPRPEGLEEDDQLGANGNGILFIGDKGMITCGGWAGRPSLLPGSKDEAYKRPAKTLPRSKGHHRDWLDACKGGTPASGNFEYGAALTEVGLLGLVALRVGKKIYWDAKAMKATNAPAADHLIKESYRPGWEPA